VVQQAAAWLQEQLDIGALDPLPASALGGE
jgi:hypothetical protein